MDLDIYEIIDIASTKPFGFTPFLPGPGVGGHCIPIDPIFIDWIARKNKTNAKFISLARRINLETTKWISLNIFKLFPKAKSKKNQVKVLIVGMAYKPNVNDIRESPGIKIYKEMIKHNNLVDFYDTKVPLIYVLGKNKFSNKIQNYKYYDFVILCTDHDDLNKKKLLEESKLIFDTRGVFKDIKLKKIVHL
jgi:UDP-N-acetyl-D-glucosamine dehydrogenase